MNTRMLCLIATLLAAGCAATDGTSPSPYVERDYVTGSNIPRDSRSRGRGAMQADIDTVQREADRQTGAPIDPNTRAQMGAGAR